MKLFATEARELVLITAPCEGNRKHCACHHAMIGADSRRLTRTFTVIDADLSEADYLDLIEASERRVWGTERDSSEVESTALDLLRLAAQFEVGTDLERYRGKIRERRLRAA